MKEKRPRDSRYCIGCGTKIMKRNLLLNNGGPLCRECATVRLNEQVSRTLQREPAA